MIADFVPFVGYLDDAAVILLVLNFGVDKDLDKYRKWNENKRNQALYRFNKIFAEEIKDFIGNGFLAAVILCEDYIIQFLITENQTGLSPIECIIKETNTPKLLLSEFSIEDSKQILELLDDILKRDEIIWVENEEKRAYMEYDFEDKWDDFIIMEAD